MGSNLQNKSLEKDNIHAIEMAIKFIENERLDIKEAEKSMLNNWISTYQFNDSIFLWALILVPVAILLYALLKIKNRSPFRFHLDVI